MSPFCLHSLYQELLNVFTVDTSRCSANSFQWIRKCLDNYDINYVFCIPDVLWSGKGLYYLNTLISNNLFFIRERIPELKWFSAIYIACFYTKETARISVVWYINYCLISDIKLCAGLKERIIKGLRSQEIPLFSLQRNIVFSEVINMDFGWQNYIVIDLSAK